MKVWRDFLFKLFGLGMVVVLAVMIASIICPICKAYPWSGRIRGTGLKNESKKVIYASWNADSI